MKKANYKPRKRPQQPRSVKMVTWILDAATRVLEKESLEGFNTNRVAEVAGVSIGSLYQYFPNKDALTVALIEKTQQELVIALTKAAELTHAKPLAESVRELARVAIIHQQTRPRLSRILDLEEQRLSPEAVLSRSARAIQTTLVDFLQQHRKDITVPNVQEAATDILTIVKALVDANTGEVSEKLERRVERAIIGYLCYS
jgi:AcrR family transcriptional regulator